MKSLLLAGMVLTQVECLTSAIYHEARGEPFTGQVLVAAVIHNRVLSDQFPNNYCDVIRQNNQFEFVSIGRWNTYDESSRDQAAFIAEQFLELPSEPIYNNILFFHSGPIPNFFQTLNHDVTVGNHRFYRLPDN